MNDNIETDAIEKMVDALHAMSRLEFQRAYMGRCGGIFFPTSGSHETNPFPPPRGYGHTRAVKDE